MTKAKAYTEKPVAEWNTKDVHAWLIDENRRRFGVTYQPFGRGSKSQAWGFEQGALKRAITEYGAEVVHRWLSAELDNYRSTTQYPVLTFGFAYSYRQNGLARAQVEVLRAEKRRERAEQGEAAAELDVEELRKLL